MEAIEQLKQEVERTIESQRRCAAQTDALLTECIRAVAGCRAALAEQPPQQAVDAARRAIAGLKVDAKLASATKELHKLVGNMGKGIDRTFCTDIAKAWSGIPAMVPLYDKIVLEHLYHEGSFEVAATLAAEARIQQSEETRQRYLDMHAVLVQIRQQNLGAALQWVEARRAALEPQGEPCSFEFHVHKVGFVQALQRRGRRAALEYGRRHLGRFRRAYLPQLQRLMGCLCFVPDGPGPLPADALARTPYADLFADEMWDALAERYVVQACALTGQAQSSPLLVAVAAGSVALPTLLKLAAVAGLQQTLELDREGHQQLPVDIPLGREFVFNSIFACPVAREQVCACWREEVSNVVGSMLFLFFVIIHPRLSATCADHGGQPARHAAVRPLHGQGKHAQNGQEHDPLLQVPLLPRRSYAPALQGDPLSACSMTSLYTDSVIDGFERSMPHCISRGRACAAHTIRKAVDEIVNPMRSGCRQKHLGSLSHPNKSA